jgi:predicted nucleic acid-binding protein
LNPSDVPAGPLLIDTDVLSYITWRRERFDDFARLIDAHLLAVSFVTIGEIRARTFASGSTWSEARRAELDAKLRGYVVLTPTDEVTRVWAQLHSRFRGRLGDGGANDMWIAACAIGQPAPVPVVTNNRVHFNLMAGEFSALVVIHPDA